MQQVQRSGGGGGQERGAGVQLGAVGDKGGLSVDDMNGHISGVLCNALMPLWKEKQRYYIGDIIGFKRLTVD